MNAVVGEASISVNTETRGEYLLVIVKGEANTITRSQVVGGEFQMDKKRRRQEGRQGKTNMLVEEGMNMAKKEDKFKQ